MPPIDVRGMSWSTSEIVVWWGAILSSVVFLWDVWKWWSAGPKLRMTIQANMETINIPEFENETVISFSVVNSGDRSTTIRALDYAYYANLWNRMVRRPASRSMIATPTIRQPTPYELKPGWPWDAMVLQTENLEKMSREGYLIFAVHHTHCKRPIRKRLIIK